MSILHRNPANKLIKTKNTQLAIIIVIADDKEDLFRKTQRCEAGWHSEETKMMRFPREWIMLLNTVAHFRGMNVPNCKQNHKILYTSNTSHASNFSSNKQTNKKPQQSLNLTSFYQRSIQFGFGKLQVQNCYKYSLTLLESMYVFLP